MMLDVDHVLFWMDAIRYSSNKDRTLESFWKGQIKSKLWLIDKIKPYVSPTNNIVIHGGWNGILASLLFQSDVNVGKIISIDINADCEEIARIMNKIEEIDGRFQAITCDMAEYIYNYVPNIVINTSCEHITQDQYMIWLNKIPNDSLIVLQSNNYKIDEHVRLSNNLEEFKSMSNINTIFSDEMEFTLYTRYMLIGYKK